MALHAIKVSILIIVGYLETFQENIDIIPEA